MIYYDFHSFMLFYFLCLLLTHLILRCYCRRKNCFSSTLVCIHKTKLIYEKSFVMRKFRTSEASKENCFEELRGINMYMKSKIFLKSCNFAQPSIILSQKTNEQNSSLLSHLGTKNTYTRTV